MSGIAGVWGGIGGCAALTGQDIIIVKIGIRVADKGYDGIFVWDMDSHMADPEHWELLRNMGHRPRLGRHGRSLSGRGGFFHRRGNLAQQADELHDRVEADCTADRPTAVFAGEGSVSTRFRPACFARYSAASDFLITES